MSGPPGRAPEQDGITGTQKAETKRHTRGHAEIMRAISGRVICAMKVQGMEPYGWQVRSLTATLLANSQAPTDEQVTAELMRAPWFPKPRRRQWRVGEQGWRTRT